MQSVEINLITFPTTSFCVSEPSIDFRMVKPVTHLLHAE